jgi:hypothetical protein
MGEWQPIETCPENTWVLTYAEWRDAPQIEIGKFRWIENSEWETVSESSGASGARRQIRQEKITREREGECGGYGGDYWMPLPAPPAAQRDMQEVGG